MATASATPIELTLRIPARRAVRETFAGCSTGTKRGSVRTGYYETKGHAVEAFSNALHDYDFCFDQEVYSDFDGNEGKARGPGFYDLTSKAVQPARFHLLCIFSADSFLDCLDAPCQTSREV